MNLFSLVIGIVGLALLIAGAVTLYHHDVVLGLIEIVVGLVLAAYATGRLRLTA